MAIAFVSAATASANIVTISTPASGSIIVVFATFEAGGTIPSLPAGYTSILTANVQPVGTYRLGYKISNGTEVNSGTWTNASSVTAVIYSGNAQAVPIIGTTVQDSNTTTQTILYDGLLLTRANLTSWVMLGQISTGGSGEPSNPTPAVTQRSGSRQPGVFDTNAAVGSWAIHTGQINDAASVGWASFVIEIFMDPPTHPPGTTVGFTSGSVPAWQQRRPSVINRGWTQDVNIGLIRDAVIPGLPAQLPSYRWETHRRASPVYGFSSMLSYALQGEVEIFPSLVTDQPNPVRQRVALEYSWHFTSPLYLPEALVALLPYSWPNPTVLRLLVQSWLWPGVFDPPLPFVTVEQGNMISLIPEKGMVRRLGIPSMPLALRGKDLFFTSPGSGPSYDWPLPVRLKYDHERYRAVFSNFGPGAILALDPLIISMVGSKL